MKGFFFRLLITAFGLWAAATIVPGVDITGWRALLVSSLLLGIVVGGSGRIERIRRIEVSGPRLDG